MSNRKSSLLLGETVYRSLCENLRNGRYRPGDHLREEEVAQQLEVSRTPVREAFNRLLSRGLLKPASGRGLVVRSLDMTEIFELYAVREILEGAAARLAAQHASQPEIEVLSDLEDSFETHLDDYTELARINRRFHETIVAAAKNRYLETALQELQDGIALLGSTTFSVPGRPAPAAKEHREIIVAIAARDPDHSEQIARRHIREALRARLRLMGSFAGECEILP